MDKRQQKPSRTEYLINKSLIVFADVIIGMLLLVFIERLSKTASGYIAVTSIWAWVFTVAGILLIAGGAYCLRRKKLQGDSASLRYIGGIDLILIGLAVILSGLLFRFVDLQYVIRFLYIAYPCIAVMYLFFALLQREFFLQAVFCAAGIILLWLGVNVRVSFSPVLIGAGFLLPILLLITGIKARRGDGTITVCKRSITLAPKGTSAFGAVFFTAAVLFVLFLLALIFTLFIKIGLSFYLVYLLCGYLFILTVYYTIKLM